MFVFFSGITAWCFLRHQASQGPLTPANAVGVVFFTICFTICVLFFNIAQLWKRLMAKWRRTEKLFFCSKYKSPSWRLKQRMLFTTLVYLILSAVEHCLAVSAEAKKTLVRMEVCGKTDIDIIRFFITHQLDFVFNNLPFAYNHFAGVFFEFLNVSYTFYWNYVNLFLILTCQGLSYRFEQINMRIETFCSATDEMWAEVREHHVKLSELLKFINQNFANLIILTCFSDAYFILVQLLNITT